MTEIELCPSWSRTYAKLRAVLQQLRREGVAEIVNAKVAQAGALDHTEKEKRLDELSQKHGMTQPIRLIENDKEEMEEREWLKKRLGYGQH